MRDRDADVVGSILRVVLGGAAEAADRLTAGDDPPDEASERARLALVGMVFDLYGVARRGVTTAVDAGTAIGRIGASVVGPLARSPLLAPFTAPSRALVDRWVRIGSDEESRGREAARDLGRIPVDEIVRYLRDNPEVAALVRAQAEGLLDDLPESPQVRTLVREQGDAYVQHLREHPEPVQELIQGQSAGMVAELLDSVRSRTVTADYVLEAIARSLLRRKPRSELPPPPAEVRARAEAARLPTDD